MNFIIGVAGGSGSGKSTVTEQIVRAIGKDEVVVFYQDHYYLDRSHLTMEERNKINFDHPDALDWQLMERQLADLCQGGAIATPNYDFTTHTRNKQTIILHPAKIIIVEGILALYDPKIYQHMALRIFVDTAADVRLMRRLKRDITERARTLESVIKQYTQFVRPMYNQFVEPTKRLAHIIIPHGSNKAALEMIISRIYSVLHERKITIDETLFISDDVY